MIAIFFLYGFTLLAQTDSPSIEEYCFNSPTRMLKVISQAKFILVPSDKVQMQERCATIVSASHRRDLIRNYIMRIDPTVQAGFSSNQIQREPCKLKVEKIKDLSSVNTEASASSEIKVSASKTQGQSTETMTIQTLKDFELSVNHSVIKGECRYISNTRYEVNLEVRKDPKPYLPPTPPGTVVVLTNPSPPPAQETLKLKTTLELSAGQRIELATIVKKLDEDSSKANLQSGVETKQLEGTQEEKLFLSIE